MGNSDVELLQRAAMVLAKHDYPNLSLGLEVLAQRLEREEQDFDAAYLRESARDMSDIPESERKRIDADFARAHERARQPGQL
jgi:hypothetical protein